MSSMMYRWAVRDGAVCVATLTDVVTGKYF